MSNTDEVKSKLGKEGADWRLKNDERLTFGQMLSSLLEEIRVSRPELAMRMFESPFNREEFGATEVVSYESMLTKVARWQNDKSIPDDRELVFQVCILLGLDAKRSRRLFERGLRASWVHPANRNELIYEFCITYNFGIMQAYGLLVDRESISGGGNQSGVGATTLSTTKYISEQYEEWQTQMKHLPPSEQIAAFAKFLARNEPHFHTVRNTRIRNFEEMISRYIANNTVEDITGDLDENNNYIYKKESPSMTKIADLLRSMRVPDAADLNDGGERGMKRIRKLLADKRFGDSNPIRKDIPLYLSGKRDIPRDIFIKMYIISEKYSDIYDLQALLVESGYPDIYVRAADGFDALIYHISELTETLHAEDYFAATSSVLEQLTAALNEPDRH